MRVWVTRDKFNLKDVPMPISVSTGTKPILHGGYWDVSKTNDLAEVHTPGSFKEKYSFTPKKGSCKQYKLSLKEIVE